MKAESWCNIAFCEFLSLSVLEIDLLHHRNVVPYFFDYKTVFSFQNSPKDLDPSYKMDLDLWDCLGRVKLVL